MAREREVDYSRGLTPCEMCLYLLLGKWPLGCAGSSGLWLRVCGRASARLSFLGALALWFQHGLHVLCAGTSLMRSRCDGLLCTEGGNVVLSSLAALPAC